MLCCVVLCCVVCDVTHRFFLLCLLFGGCVQLNTTAIGVQPKDWIQYCLSLSFFSIHCLFVLFVCVYVFSHLIAFSADCRDSLAVRKIALDRI